MATPVDSHKVPSAKPPSRSFGLGGVLGLLLMGVGVLLLLGGIWWLTAAQRAWKPPATREEALREAIAEFEKAIALDPSLQEGYAGLSKAYELSGDVQAAVQVWERAAKANPIALWPYLEQEALYRRHGMDSEAKEAFLKAFAIEPLAFLSDGTYREKLVQAFGEMGFLTSGVTYSLEQPLQNGWKLLGYHTDEGTLARGEAVKLILFWRAPEREQPSAPEKGWRHLTDNVWMQVLPASRSVLKNGSFEQKMKDGRIPGFPEDIYAAPAKVRRVEVITRDGEATRVAVLANGDDIVRSSLVSDAMAVDANNVYLQTGWIQTEGGVAYAGWRWLGGRVQKDTALSYAAEHWESAQWRHFASLAEPPPEAEAAQVLLANVDGHGAARFDDVTWVPVPNPLNLLDLLHQLLRTEAAGVEVESLMTAPMVTLNLEVADGWTLVGYVTDEVALAAGTETPLAIVWRGPAGVSPGSAQAGWHALEADLWVQIIPQARNLVRNGDFEQGLQGGAPVGFAKSIYDEDPSIRQVQLMERNGIETHVAALANNDQFTKASFISDPFSVDARQLYLQGAWVWAPQGNAYVGHHWLGDRSVGKRDYAYIAAKVQTDVWLHLAGIAEPLPKATAGEMWLLNFKSTHPVAFDDVFIVPIARPGE